MASFDLLSKYLLIMELRFEAMLYSKLGNVNSVAGHIKCSRVPQVPHPCSYGTASTMLFFRDSTTVWLFLCHVSSLTMGARRGAKRAFAPPWKLGLRKKIQKT